MKEKRKLKLKNILAVYGRDFKNIATNPVALIVTLGLVVLPSLYAWVNIIACWDPYGSTSGIKVAVVNLDEGVMLQNEAINVGNMIIDNLKENHSIGWQFVNEEEAEYGLTHDKYYAMLEIPADFSVCGCDNTSISKYRGISLTSVESYAKQTGQKAVDILVRKIEGKVSHFDFEDRPDGITRIEYYPKLIIRKSTGPRAKKSPSLLPKVNE